MLKGSLQTVALPEVLNFLAETRKSGEFHVSGGHGEGRLWFDQGRISGIEVPRAQEPSEAIFELLRIDDGEFDFASEADRPEDVRVVEFDSGEVGPALAAAEAKLAEWRDIVAVVPSLAHRAQLRAETPAGPVTLEPDQWMMVVAIGAGGTVAEVIDSRDMQEFDGCKAVRALVEASLVEIAEPEVEEPEVEAPVDEEPVIYEPVAEEPVVEEPVAEVAVAEVAVADEPVAASPVHDLALNGNGLGFGMPEVGVHDEPSLEPFSFFGAPSDSLADSPAGSGNGSSEGDHYAALRAAMVEIGDNLTTDEDEVGDDEQSDHPVYEFHADPEMDGRAALQALLSEVTEDSGIDPVVHDDSVDGLADRGPWTEHELSAMDSQQETWGEPEADMSNVVPFAPVHAAEVEGAGEADVAGEGAAEEAEAEEPAPVEEPINRGLLLKFLSSVRN